MADNTKMVDLPGDEMDNQQPEYGGRFQRLRTRAAGFFLNPEIGSHPIILMIREQELGKSILTLGGAVAIGIALGIEKSSRSTVLGHLVLTGLSAGCMAIWNGIVFRGTFQRAALVMEHVGIFMVLMSFYGLVASELPVGLAWVPLLCGGLCALPPFLISGSSGLCPAAAAADVGRMTDV